MRCEHFTGPSCLKRCSATGLALVFLVSLAALATPGLAGPDLSTPKKAGVAFAKALVAGDMETLHQVAIGTDADFEMLHGSTLMLAAMKRLDAAAFGKFGEQGKLGPGMSMDNFVAEFEGSDEKITADKATLELKSRPNDPHPPTLKKEGEGWKVELAELSRDLNSKDLVKVIPVIVAALDGVTKDVQAGKYKTAAEAKADMQSRMFTAMMSAQPAASQPAAHAKKQ